MKNVALSALVLVALNTPLQAKETALPKNLPARIEIAVPIPPEV